MTTAEQASAMWPMSPWRIGAVVPAATIGQGEQQAIALLYLGILADSGVVGSPGCFAAAQIVVPGFKAGQTIKPLFKAAQANVPGFQAAQVHCE